MDQDRSQRASPSVCWSASLTRSLVRSALIVALAVSCTLLSCSETTAPEYVWTTTDYSVPIDSMRVTSPVVLGDTLRVWLWGEVGPAPCYEFHQIWAAHWTDWQVHLTAMGSQSTGGPCSGPITYLEGEEYAYVPPSVGLVEIEVYPGLIETVEVVPPEHWRLGPRSN